MDAVADLLRRNAADQVCRTVRVAVRGAVEARDAAARPFRPPILGLVELLLRERREQQAKALDLLGVQDAVETLVVVVDREQLAPRDVTEVGARREGDGRGELREKGVR